MTNHARCSRRHFLGGALAAGTSATLFDTSFVLRGRCGRGRSEAAPILTQDQARPDRLRRARAVAGRSLPKTRRLRYPRRGRLLRRLGPAGRRSPGRREEAPILGPGGLQTPLAERRRGRGRGERAEVPCRTRPRGDRRRLPRLRGQAGGGRRAAGDRGPGGGQIGDAEKPLLPGRLPDGHRPGEHRSRRGGSTKAGSAA